MISYRLIDNEYNPEETFEILSFLLGTKIKFLNRRKFEILESGGSAQHIDKRIEELRLSQEKLFEDMMMTKRRGEKLKINCIVEVEAFQKENEDVKVPNL